MNDSTFDQIRGSVYKDLSEFIPIGRVEPHFKRIDDVADEDQAFAQRIHRGNDDQALGKFLLRENANNRKFTERHRLAANVIICAGDWLAQSTALSLIQKPSWQGSDETKTPEHLIEVLQRVKGCQFALMVAMGAYMKPLNPANQKPFREAQHELKMLQQDDCGPTPLTTAEIATCFAGLRWTTEEQWKDLLGKGRDWTKRCVEQSGTRGRGGVAKLWNPVKIGNELVRIQDIEARSVRARFQTKPRLQPWLNAWEDFEADNFSNEDKHC